MANATLQAKTAEGSVRTKTVSAYDGTFALRGLDPRKQYQLVIKASGYESVEQPFTFTSATADRVYGKKILLQPSSKPVAGKSATSTTGGAVFTANQAVPEIMVKATASPGSGSNGNQRVTPPKTLDAKVVFSPPLTVAPPGKTTQLKAIQFVQSKADLLPDAQPALEQLLAFMRSRPTVEILLAGHTDNQGDFDENVRLSQQRVDVVKAYLVQNGIAANRIATRGYGPTRPIGNNNKEATRQQNRRVELVITKE
ncbi:flagellar motor protein MotB [Spirosoma montaniterrae]|uniref:Flagellar motor protein MotB n=1 Tax=Spirosoma montaniterrae TaxID=1178516 RepID=A0A1P9X4E2_9BACT|nr:flagellar motor protein MotB [Spirosoma montaniterrae]